jgi:hypothetical protein
MEGTPKDGAQPYAPRAPDPGSSEPELLELCQEGRFSLGGRGLYPHQWENLDRAATEFQGRSEPRGLVIADAPGLGKTVSALAVSALGKALSGRRCVLITVPVVGGGSAPLNPRPR